MYQLSNFIFNCDQRAHNIDSQFDIILKNCILSETNFKQSNATLFGLKIRLDKISVKTIHHLFATLRKYLNYLRNTILTANEIEFISISHNSGLKLDWSFLRKEIVSALSLFKYLLNHETSTCTIETKRIILNELRHFLLSINRISHLPGLIFYELFAATSNKKSSTNQLFHLYLDIWWNTYQIFKFVDPMLREDICLIRDKNFTVNDLLNQSRNILLSDLIAISLIKFNINRLDTNYLHLDIYTCSCSKLIYVLIYLESNDGIGFWNNFNKILDDFTKIDNQQVESVRHFQWINNQINIKPDHLASLWLISNLTDLFRQDLKIGEKQIVYQDNNIYVCSIIKNLIRKFEKNQNQTDEFATILKLCFKLSKNFNIEIVFIFFDFFMKNLDTPFQLNENIKNMQMIPKSGNIWYQKVICFETINIKNEENINQIFFLLIHEFVKLSVNNHSISNHFQKFKGRLYSKLQLKKIEELKEIGLYNLLNIFIITSYASKNDSVIDLLNKFSFVIKVIKNKGLCNSRIMLIFRSLFCFNYFLINNQDLNRLNEIIVELFNEICESIPNWSLNNIQVSTIHNAYFELVNIYCNEILDYLKKHESPNQVFSNLFKCKFGCLVSKLSEREVLFMLEFIYKLVEEIRIKIENEDADLLFYANIYELINEQFIDFLKLQMRTIFNPLIPNIIYEFIHITNLVSSSEQNFKNLIDNFLINKSTNMLNLFELIFKISNSNIIFSKIIDVYYDCDLNNKFIELWFQLAVTIQMPNEKFDKLTKQLSNQFPLFKTSNNSFLAIQDVFSNIHKNYLLSISSQDKARLSFELNQCLGGMVNQGKNILKDENVLNEEKFYQLYTILSYLVLNCSQMIHIQGNNNSILPQLLETFFNPNFIQSLSTVKVQSINNCLRKTLPKVLNGLAGIHQKFNDPYIDRKIKILFITYVPLFLIKNSPHPILIELNQSKSSDLFSTILYYIKDCLFIKPPTPDNPALTIQLIQFTNEFYSLIRNTNQKNQLFKLFPLFLSKMLNSQELIKRKIRDLLTLMVKNEDENLNNNLVEFYEEFIKKNGHFLIRVIKVLEFTLPICLLIREKLISILMHMIKQIEESASGVDDLLRVCFQQFINKISN